jgi:hypothetical protein
MEGSNMNGKNALDGNFAKYLIWPLFVLLLGWCAKLQSDVSIANADRWTGRDQAEYQRFQQETNHEIMMTLSDIKVSVARIEENLQRAD